MPDATSRAEHDAHADARNEHAAKQRVETLLVLEEHARETARAKTVTPLVQEPAHQFRTPIVARFDRDTVVDHMLAPGSFDDTGFAPGCVV